MVWQTQMLGTKNQNYFKEGVTLNRQFSTWKTAFCFCRQGDGFCKGGRWRPIVWSHFVKVGVDCIRERRFQLTGDRFSDYVCCSPGILRGSMTHFEGTDRASFVSPDLPPCTLPGVACCHHPWCVSSMAPEQARFSFPRFSSPSRITPHSCRFSTSTWWKNKYWLFAQDLFGKTSRRKTAIGSMESVLPFICILYQTINTFHFLK